jgi:mannose-6-phosphate isomerase-like protein (cupin superfamily)
MHPLPSPIEAVAPIESEPVEAEPLPLVTDPALTQSPLLPKIVKSGSGERLELRGETRHILIDSRDTAGQVALSHTVMAPGMGTPTHTHTREEEMFLVTEGHFLFCVGGHEFEVGPNDFVFAPRHIPHSYRCTGEVPGKMFIWVLGAGFEDFFRAQALAEELNPAILTEMAAQFGVRIGGKSSAPVATVSPRVMHLDRQKYTVELNIIRPQTQSADVITAYGDTAHVLVPQTEVEGRYVVLWDETPSLSGPPLHVHERGDELFLILEGRYEFTLGDARVQVGPGDVLFAPRGIAHSFRVISGENGRTIITALPGDFETFFRESAALFAQGLVPDILRPQLLAVWARYDMTLVQTGL